MSHPGDMQAIEKWVRRLTPPANREEVLGDLAERSDSPRAYLRDALRTLPFVIGSRIRRTTHPLGVLLSGAFLYWPIFSGNQQSHWLAALVPTVLMVAVLALRDAYRDPADLARWKRAQAIDVGLAAGAALLSQGLLWLAGSTLLLTRGPLPIAFPVGIALLYLVRLQGLSGLHPPAGFARQLSAGELRAEIAIYESVIRRAVHIEIGACVVVAAVFLAYALWLPGNPPIGRVGQLVTVAGAGFVAIFLWRHGRVRPVPAGSDFDATLRHYRADMARRVRISRRYPWWYIAPVMTGPAIWIVGSKLLQPGGLRDALVALAIGLAVATVLTMAHIGGAAKAQKRVEQLALVTEKPQGEMS